jgi:hypothetical protein
MSCCACCCFYPKYKRKVDNIYPRSYELPLVKIEVEKLQYYVKQHPEKLSKIGEYLYQHLKWGLNGTYKNRNYVKNTIEAVDKILFVITPQNLNYYATNYLKIIQKLLEQGAPTSTNNNNNTGTNNSSSASSSNNNVNNNNNDTNIEYLEYQKLAADLFRKFCEKEAANESTTNYNLNYDTFVCQFSSMCYNNNKDELARAELRSSGLQCLATMVKRLVPEDSLRATYLWENMNKIVPALLFIMHETFIENLKQRGNSQSHADSDENQLLPYLDNDFNSKNKYLNQFQQQQSIDNQIDYDSSQVTINRNDLDSVKIEFTRSNNNNEPGSAKVSGKGSTKSSSSVNDEQNAMLQHKYTTNLITKTTTPATATVSTSNPDHEAKMLLKHLACRADYTTISKIVKPILDYLDTNKASGWEHIGFIRCIFLILMYNVKQQHAIVIKELIKHLDSHINSSAKLKCRIIGAISVCIRTAAMHSVGTTGQIIEIFTYFIKHLKLSVERQAQLRVQLLQKNLNNKSSNSEIPTMSTFLNNNNNNGENNNNFNKIQMDLSEEQNLQAKIIEAMGQFTINLPDYSKNDVITLIAHQISSQQFNYTDLTSILNTNQQLQQQNAKDQLNTQLRGKYFECLYEISTKYRPSQLFSAFTNGSFLEDILRLTLVADWASSRKAHEIIQHLLDKNQLLSRIKKLKPSFFNDYSKTFVYGSESTSSFKTAATTAASAATNQQMKTFLSQLNLNETTNKLEISREDIQFMRKNGRMLLGHLNENLFLLNNRRENFESIYITTCLIIFGLFNENEFLIDLIRFGFHVQELALLNYEHTPFSFSLQCSVHKFVCAYFVLLGKSSGCAALIDYCLEICEKRMKKGVYHYIFPEYILLDRRPASCLNGDDSMDTDFKRDLQQSAKEYYNSIDKTTNTQETINELDTSIKDGDDQTVTTTKISSKMAPWLFCKKTIGAILDKSGFQSIGLFNQSKDFSLSFNYLQQTIKTVQTALKYRSPYSNSFDSLSNIRHEISMQNIINNPDLTNGMTNGVQGHSRMNSKSIGGVGGGVQSNNMYQMRESPSFHQIGTTPRRSIDNDSYLDDDTSYDSMSQISIDQQQPLNDNKLFFIDPSDDINQLTINSFNFSTKQQYQDMSSFETIKRLISNGTGIGNNNNRTSGATSLIGNALPTANSGISASSISRNMTNLRNSTGASVIVAAAKLEQSSTEDQESNNSSSETIETNQRIINEFKQKPFDELKQTLLRSNNLNQEKYQQVFDSISKEIIVNRDNLMLQQQQQLNNTTSNNSSLNGSNPNLNDSVYIKETNIQQKLVTNLNDIDFPQLFMY